MTQHILPVNDLKEHEQSTTCECEPRVEILDNGDILVVHSSWDGREAMEEVNAILLPNIKKDSEN